MRHPAHKYKNQAVINYLYRAIIFSSTNSFTSSFLSWTISKMKYNVAAIQRVYYSKLKNNSPVCSSKIFPAIGFSFRWL